MARATLAVIVGNRDFFPDKLKWCYFEKPSFWPARYSGFQHKKLG
jgi:hypothetical protein